MTDAGGAFYEGAIKGGTALDREWATFMDTLKEAAIPLGQILSPAVVQTITSAAAGIQGWGRAFDELKTKAEAVGKNPVVQRVLGLTVGKVADGVKFIGSGGLLGTAFNRLAGDQKEKPTPKVVQTPQDRAKEAAQDAAAAAAAAEAIEKQETAIDKLNKKQIQRQKAREQERVQSLQNIALAQELIKVQEKIAPGGQGFAISGINPQTVAQVQQIATTIDLTGSRFGQTLVQGATKAGQELLKAQEQLQAAERAAFDLLTDKAQEDLKRQAILDINQNRGKTRLDEAKIEETLGIDLQGPLQEAIDNVDARKLFEVRDQVLKNAEASVNLKAATEANTKALTDLITAYATGAIVNVTVPAGSAVGGDAQTEVRYN
jgi:uncharacterized protein YbjQ (UPF0145 family)